MCDLRIVDNLSEQPETDKEIVQYQDKYWICDDEFLFFEDYISMLLKNKSYTSVTVDLRSRWLRDHVTRFLKQEFPHLVFIQTHM